tara:strand:- start:342 stop:455 length:114 start_codon:yes stop_codon:yes gene_type:complete
MNAKRKIARSPEIYGKAVEVQNNTSKAGTKKKEGSKK